MNTINAKVNLSALSDFAIVMSGQLKLFLIIAVCVVEFIILVLSIVFICVTSKRKKKKKQAEQAKSLISLLSDTPIEFDKTDSESVPQQAATDADDSVDSIMALLNSDEIAREAAQDDKIVSDTPAAQEELAQIEQSQDFSILEAKLAEAMDAELDAALACLDDVVEQDEPILPDDSVSEDESSQEDFFAELEKLAAELASESANENAAPASEIDESANDAPVQQDAPQNECYVSGENSLNIAEQQTAVLEDSAAVATGDGEMQLELEDEWLNDEQLSLEPLVSVEEKIAKKKNELIDLRSQLPNIVDEETGRALYGKFYGIQQNLDSDEKSDDELVNLIILSRKDVAFAVQMARYKKILANRVALRANSAQASKPPRR